MFFVSIVWGFGDMTLASIWSIPPLFFSQFRVQQAGAIVEGLVSRPLLVLRNDRFQDCMVEVMICLMRAVTLGSSSAASKCVMACSCEEGVVGVDLSVLVFFALRAGGGERMAVLSCFILSLYFLHRCAVVRVGLAEGEAEAGGGVDGGTEEEQEDEGPVFPSAVRGESGVSMTSVAGTTGKAWAEGREAAAGTETDRWGETTTEATTARKSECVLGSSASGSSALSSWSCIGTSVSSAPTPWLMYGSWSPGYCLMRERRERWRREEERGRGGLKGAKFFLFCFACFTSSAFSASLTASSAPACWSSPCRRSSLERTVNS
jgi:hypothetical protein